MASFAISGLGFIGFGVWGVRLRVQGLGFLGCKTWGLGCRVWGLPQGSKWPQSIFESEGTAMGPGFLHAHYFPHFVDCYKLSGPLGFLHT